MRNLRMQECMRICLLLCVLARLFHLEKPIVSTSSAIRE